MWYFVAGLVLGAVGGLILAVFTLARVNAEMICEAIEAGSFEIQGIEFEIREVVKHAQQSDLAGAADG